MSIGSHVLYLRDGVPWRVRLDADVALQLISPHGTQRRVPLRCLSRVVAGSSVRWDTPALLACARAGVPITFEDRRNQPVAWCLGVRRRQHRIGALLALALECHRWSERYGQWLRNQHNHAMAQLRDKHRLRSERLEAERVTGQLCNLLYQRLGYGVGPLLSASKATVSAWASRELGERLGDPLLLMHGRPGWTLLTDLCDLLHWSTLDMLASLPAARITPGNDAARWFALRMEIDDRPWREPTARALAALETLLNRHYA